MRNYNEEKGGLRSYTLEYVLLFFIVLRSKYAVVVGLLVDFVFVIVVMDCVWAMTVRARI